MMAKKQSPYLDPLMAGSYAEASARIQFDRPAQDLASWLQVAAGDHVLDVGSGTGTVAAAAARAVGTSGWVVALDSSITMLRQQQRNEVTRRIVAGALDLPFGDQVFDRVAAGFSITHFPDYAKALAEIRRVLRPGGMLGATSWASGQPNVSELWKDTIKQFADSTMVQEEFSRIIPWDELFSFPENLAKVFQKAGLVDVRTGTREYLISCNAQEYAATKIGSVEGTIVRKHLQEQEWKRLLEQLIASLQSHFPARIEYPRRVHFVAGRRPA